MKVAIVGASGYTGLELIKILINHPKFELVYLATSDGDTELSQLHPSLESVFNTTVQKAETDKIAEIAELVFLAVPHKTAMNFVKELRKKEILVVDLSADYRLKKETYEQFYVPHIDEENLKNAIYGMPELYKSEIQKAKLVANPGCYPTASILGTIPFLEFKAKNSPIIIDAKSGVSGAGKKLSETTHFVKVNDNFFAYSPLNHRHTPEIEEKLSLASGENQKVVFVPQLLPLTRGMINSIYITIDKKNSDLDFKNRVEEFYKNSKFIRIREKPPTMKDVAGTHFCDIFVAFDKESNTLFVQSAIDNLLRGASSLAVANANLMAGFDEYLGLPTIAYNP
jgi:N-acetyl-gamma-glutamyl-phosphate reductase